jgi:alanine racemase
VLDLADLADVTGARVLGPRPTGQATGFAYDTRAGCQGAVFLALRTETGDGHDYICEAIQQGAAAVLCEYLPPGITTTVPVLLVPDVLVAVSDWAASAFRRWQPLTIAVAGSVGKTTTKEILARGLARFRSVESSPGNLSGKLGLPVALSRMQRRAEVAVLEFAASAFGEMQAMAACCPPDLLICLNVAERYLSQFGSKENMLAELARVFETGARPIVVANAEDPHCVKLTRLAPAAITFGLSAGELRAVLVGLAEDGLRFKLGWGGEAVGCRAKLYSPLLIHNCLAAAGAALELGLSPAQVAVLLGAAEPLPGRLQPLQASGGALVLDDTYSACPTSLIAAMEGLLSLPARKRLALLGEIDDLEMAEDAVVGALHRALAAGVHVWGLADGKLAELVARSRLAGEIQLFADPDGMAAQLGSLLAPGVVVLVKGNAASRMEKAISLIVAPTERQRLVRQDGYWERVRLVKPERPTWIELDTQALAHNVRVLREHCGVPLMAVVKGDAYGHGMVRVARTALKHGAVAVGVACLSEGLALRRAGIDAPILVLGYTPAWQAREAVRAELRCAVFAWEEAEALAQAARALGKQAKVHVKVDTGMYRLGLAPDEAFDLIQGLARCGDIVVEGIFTHFARADEQDRADTLRQLELFIGLLDRLQRCGLRPAIAHAANTAAALAIPEARLDMVRIGIGLYGLSPGPAVALPEGCRPVLSWKTVVVQVKDVPAGAWVGYGRHFQAPRDMRIAVLPVGYGDGFRRGPRNWGAVLIRGQRCPVVGAVSMDQCMVDVTHVPGVRKGDEVVLIGRQGSASIGVEEIAHKLGTIPYEVVSQILARVPRVS